MSSKLKGYLEKIEQNKPLNYKAFLSVLEIEGVLYDEAIKNMDIRRVGKSSQYLIESITPTFKAKLGALTMDINASRAQAARLNKSHSVRVNGSFILRRLGAAHPEVVIIANDGTCSGTSVNKKALIIENRQNFLSIEDTIAFLHQYCSLTIDSSWDVLFGAGGEISNHLHSQFLSEYTDIFMYLDVDVGGLNVAMALASRTPNAQHHFVLPHDIGERLESLPIKANQSVLEEAYRIGLSIPFLHEASSNIVNNQNTIEQESYLA